MIDATRRREQLRYAARRYYRGHVHDVGRCKMLHEARHRGRVPREQTLSTHSVDGAQIAAALMVFLAPHAKNRTCACVHASQPPRAPPTAAAAAFARSQPSLHLTDDASRPFCAALAVVGAAAAPPPRRRWALRRAPRAGLTGRCGARVPPQARAGGRGRRQRVQGCGWRAQSARGRGGWPRFGRWVARRRPRFGARLGCPRRGREIATVRVPQRLGGASRRVRAGVGVLVGRARAGRGDAEASQVPSWPPPRVNMCACDVHNLGDTFEIESPVWVLRSCTSASRRLP